MIYNGFDFSLYMVDEDIRESILPETVVDALDVPGADGQLFNSATFGTRVIEIDVRVIRENRRALNELLPFLASKLHSRTPTKLYTRLHPGEYYIAMLTGTIDFEKWFGTGGATVTFVAYNPVRYVDDDRTVALGYAAKDVQIMGTYLARPIVAIDIPAACSYVAVSDMTTGLVMRSEYAFKAGNRVVFDCTVGTDRMKVPLLYATATSTTPTKLPITPQSRWFELEPGTHTMRILNASSAVSATMTYAERRL